jgi:hypothetical protein
MNQKKLSECNRENIVCQDGPFKGEVLRFSINGTTLVFTVKGQTGYYKNGYWNAQVS